MQSNSNKKIYWVVLGVILMFAMIAALVLLGRHNNQQALLDKQQANFAKTATADPILKYLPYGTLEYNITPTFKSVNGNRS
jgi:flagellar basal body-associated protein FliL